MNETSSTVRSIPTSPALAAPSALAAVLAAVIAVAGCGGTDAADNARAADLAGTPPPVTVEPLPTPAGPASGEPNLTVGPDGFYLSWLERTGEGRYALKFSRWEGSDGAAGGWTQPGTIMDRTGLFVNWADFPSLVALEDGTLAAHWLEKSGPGAYSYDVRMALSSDGGESWSDDVIPHTDGVEAEHGFVSLFPVDAPAAAADGQAAGQAAGQADAGQADVGQAAEQAVGAVWLDGRETVEGKPMTIRYATIARDGSLHEEALLDASACDCCQTGAAIAEAGPVVVYRDRTEGEVRDIYITRRVDGEWTEGRAVHDDGWVIPGCPVNGPSVDADGSHLAVAWFTGAPEASANDDLGEGVDRSAVRRMGENGRVMVAFSGDGGATFAQPIRVDDGSAMGRVTVNLLEDGSALVLWLERVEGRAEVRLRQVNEAGVGESMSLTSTAAERASGFPRMAIHGERLMFAWTETGEDGTIRTAMGRIGAPAVRVAGAGEAAGGAAGEAAGEARK